MDKEAVNTVLSSLTSLLGAADTFVGSPSFAAPTPLFPAVAAVSSLCCMRGDVCFKNSKVTVRVVEREPRFTFLYTGFREPWTDDVFVDVDVMDTNGFPRTGLCADDLQLCVISTEWKGGCGWSAKTVTVADNRITVELSPSSTSLPLIVTVLGVDLPQIMLVSVPVWPSLRCDHCMFIIDARRPCSQR